jgi:hypothetical protein
MDLRMRYTTHAARDVINQSGLRDDLNLYWQVALIQVCHNHAPKRVIKALQYVGAKAAAMGIVSNKFTLGKKMAEGLHPKILGPRIHTIEFSAKQIWNLYLVDNLVLVSDYSAHMEDLMNILGRIDASSIEELAVETGPVRMAIFMAQMESYLGVVDREGEALRNMSTPTIDKVVPVDPEANEALKKALNMLEKEEG